MVERHDRNADTFAHHMNLDLIDRIVGPPARSEIDPYAIAIACAELLDAEEREGEPDA